MDSCPPSLRCYGVTLLSSRRIKVEAGGVEPLSLKISLNFVKKHPNV